jgi:golgi phosphoprotein 3
MNNRETLRLHEAIMLLALRDREGTVAASSYHYAIGGAALAELLLAGRIEVAVEGKKRFAHLRDQKPLGDPLLDDGLARIAAAKRRAQLQTWVARFAGTRDLKHRVAGELVRRGILRVDKDRILGIFSRTIYPELDPRPERALIARLEAAIFDDTTEVDAWTVVLVSLAHSSDLLRHTFDRKRLKHRRRRIEQISNGEATGAATRAAIEAMQAAVMIACVIPALYASTTVASR